MKLRTLLFMTVTAFALTTACKKDAAKTETTDPTGDPAADTKAADKPAGKADPAGDPTGVNEKGEPFAPLVVRAPTKDDLANYTKDLAGTGALVATFKT